MSAHVGDVADDGEMHIVKALKLGVSYAKLGVSYLSFDPARVDAVTGCKTSLFGLGLLNLTISAEIR